MVTMLITNYRTRKILLDNSSSADILYMKAFEHMGFSRNMLQLVNCPFLGFAGDRIYPVGTIPLLVTMGSAPNQITTMVKFLVDDYPSTYHAIIRCTTLNNMKAVTSTYHLKIKFSADDGVGEVKEDLITTCRCYMASLEDPNSKGALTVKEVEIRDKRALQQAEPVETLVEVPLHQNEPSRTVRLEGLAIEDLRRHLLDFL